MMGTSYSRSYSLGSVFKARFVRINAENIRGQVHALNESVQRQLEEANKRYMELYVCYKRDKEQQTQQIQFIEYRMTTMHNYFKQMQSGDSSSSAQPTPPPRPQPSPCHHTFEDNDDGISDIIDDQYSQFLGFFFLELYYDNFFYFFRY